MKFILSLDIETVFNPSCMMTSIKKHEVSTYMRSKTLSLIVNAIKYPSDDFINFSRLIIVSSNFGSLLFSFIFLVHAPLSYRCLC
jgi:hypothetical protein